MIPDDDPDDNARDSFSGESRRMGLSNISEIFMFSALEARVLRDSATEYPFSGSDFQSVVVTSKHDNMAVRIAPAWTHTCSGPEICVWVKGRVMDMEFQVTHEA
eukprot:1342639-Amorphochlora_amoeboformis.AAC.1